MSLTFVELQDRTLYMLDDVNAGYFSRTQIKRSVNDAQQEVQKLLIKAGEGWYEKCVETTCVRDQADYALPDEFRKVEEAVKFLEEDESGNFYVLKGNDDSAKTVVPTTEDLETMRRHLEGKLEAGREDYERKGFILETRIPEPCEFTPQCVWYGGEVVFMDVDIENKPIGAGNVGCQVGAAQTLVTDIHRGSEMAELAFPKAIMNVAAKRTGMFVFDASILMDQRDRSMYFGEFCSCRMGYDSFYAELAMSRSVSGFFEDVASGINPLIRDYGAAVRMLNLTAKPAYLGDSTGGKEIVVRHDANAWLMDAKEEDGMTVTAGYITDLASVTGYGKEAREAINMAHDEIEQVAVLDAYFRPEQDFLSGDYSTSIMRRLCLVHDMTEEKKDCEEED